MDRKLTMLSRALADLTARAKGMVTTAELQSIFNAATAVLQPYDSAPARLLVTSVAVTKPSGVAIGTVVWSCARGANATARPQSSTVPVPAGFDPPTGQTSTFVLVEAQLPYTPMFGHAITGTIDLTHNTPWPVRNGTTAITLQNNTCPTFPS
jgi:hypothetical protein